MKRPIRIPVTVQSVTYAPSPSGEKVATWTDTIPVYYVTIKPLTGSALDRGRAYGAQVSHQMGGQYRPEITAKQRIKMGARIFTIDAALNVGEAGRELLIYATEYLK